jgi:hypothetical protein
MYEVTMDIYSIRLISQAVKLQIERWAGGDPFEQELLKYIDYNLNKIVLDHNLSIADARSSGE